MVLGTREACATYKDSAGQKREGGRRGRGWWWEIRKVTLSCLIKMSMEEDAERLTLGSLEGHVILTVFYCKYNKLDFLDIHPKLPPPPNSSSTPPLVPVVAWAIGS